MRGDERVNIGSGGSQQGTIKIDTLEKYELTMNEKQRQLHRLRDVAYILYGGAVGGGKSVALVMDIFYTALLNEYNRIYFCRKRFSDLKISTLLTFKDWFPEELILEHNKTDKVIRLRNMTEIYYGGLDDEKDVKKLASSEFGAIYVDQGEELEENEFNMLASRLRLKLKGGKHPEYRLIITCNPHQGWLKHRFILNPGKDYRFIQALPRDNEKNLPESYLPRLQEIYKNRPELYKAYVEGSWDEVSGGNLVIQSSWLDQCIDNKVLNLDYQGIKRVVSCDPARFGDDETVNYVIEDYKVVEQEIYGQRSTMETAGQLVRLRKRRMANLIPIDAIGIGGGIVDRLVELGEPVYPIASNEVAKDPDKYKNLKAQMWWEVADKFRLKEASIPNDPVLKAQLSTITYDILSDGRIRLETKDVIKRRLGSSPNRADSLVMGLWAMQFADAVAEGFTGPVFSKKVIFSGRAGWVLFFSLLIKEILCGLIL